MSTVSIILGVVVIIGLFFVVATLQEEVQIEGEAPEGQNEPVVDNSQEVLKSDPDTVISPPVLSQPFVVPKVEIPHVEAPQATTTSTVVSTVIPTIVPTSTVVEIVATSTATTSVAVEPPPSPLPPLDEASLLRAVVKIQCPAVDNTGIYVGSGFVVNDSTVVTAAHVVINAGDRECDVIFPSKRKPVHYLSGTLEDSATIKKRHDEEGIDVALLTLPSLDSYPEAKAIFNTAYPFIPYSICKNPALFGDELLHFGYPSNFKDQSYLSELEGKVVALADIDGITSQLSLDQTVAYKTPIFAYSDDETVMHPYMISRVPSFYGDSGGLAFNKTKQCVLGPHRGGTIGKAAGENFTIFMNLGWGGARALLE